MVVVIGAADSPISELSTAIALPKNVLELHRQAHVALDLELSAHESHGPVELAVHQVEEVGGGHGDGDVGALRLAAAELAAAIGHLHPLLPATVPPTAH